MSKKIDENCLIVRNFPSTFTEDEIRDFLQMFDPIQMEIFVENHAAFAEFPNKEHSRNILTLLHQVALDNNRLFVEFAPKNRNQLKIQFLQEQESMPVQCKSTTADEISEEIGETIKKLYATAEDLNLMQPPPPYLRYEYPNVNRDIIDAIGIALECIPKFYVQVLHLMNRMNLEPPFVPGDKKLVYESSLAKVQYANVSTQTDEISWQNFAHNKRKLVETDESELESSAEENDEYDQLKTKRKKLIENDSNRQELLKQKQRNLFKMQRIQKQLESSDKPVNVQMSQQSVGEAFELNQKRVKTSGIKIVVPEVLEMKSNESTAELKTSEPTTSFNIDPNSLADDVDRLEVTKSIDHIWTDSELTENRIPSDQLKGHPMFQNYNPGEISNRLYIKNIAKEVTEIDLRSIYNRYLEENCDGHGNIRTIEIRHMTTGRMKGQAFITFDGPYLNCDDDDNEQITNLEFKYQMIVKALRETNGLILKGKPLVVAYGKKK